ncbi:MAG TPA: 3-phosphoserine/phosphohydroxythreonine transaminase [Gammaproteobacteria bacterium]|nr:3-phosphoserine/phosphohydroxythreonine transaminase [Gammaproteobacteria bacterium]
MRRVYNFSAGPGMLPEEVMLRAQKEFQDWNGTGMSIMELGHRGPEFQGVAEKAEADLRELMNIPKNYHVLFLTGGASAQFAMVPLNLMSKRKKADYVDTGIWSKKAIDEAKRYGEVNVAAKSKVENTLVCIPDQESWVLSSDADYLHYTPNETIDGVEFKWVPESGDVPLVADMSSMILSQPVDVTKFGLIYAGAQKNMGQAGITVVIVRDDLVRDSVFLIPSLYQYKLQAEHHSFYNTPPTYSWYIAGLVFDWLKRHGGVDAMHQVNLRKAKKLYSFIDDHKGFYYSSVKPENRSIMNVVFSLTDEKLNDIFLSESNAAGLTNLRGHRIVGGMRASIYNAMPEEGVDALIEFMRDFAKQHG